MKLRTKKIIYTALSLTMASTIAASQIIAFANQAGTSSELSERVQEASFNELTGSIDLSQVALDNLSDKVVDYGEEEAVRNITGANAIKTVIVNLDTASIVESKGDDMSVAEYLQTNAGQRALKAVQASQQSFFKQLSSAGIAYKEVARYSSVINAVAIEVNTSQFKKLSKFTGVSMAGVSKTYSAMSMPDAQENPSNVYGTGIYDSTEIMAKYGYDGSGVTVAILDTGLDYTHEAFSYDPETVAFDKAHIEDAIEKVDSNGVNLLVAAQRTPGLTADDVYLSAKVPFAYDYADDDTDVYPSYSQHGVHVAGIVAGKADTYIDKDGNQVGEENDGKYDFMGVAPEAQLVICKVFTDDLDSEDLGGATSEDIVAALDDCVTLGVDIINMSLGTTSGFSNMEIEGDSEGAMLNKCYENIKAEGISLIAAAGNEYSSGFGSEFGTNLASNPDSGTVGSPSTFAGAMSVASINGQTSPFMVGNPDENSSYGDAAIYYQNANDANSVPFDFAEELLGNQTSATFTYLVIPGTGAPGDYSQTVQRRLKPVSKGGTKQDGEKIIVVVRRGNLSFQEKVENAQQMYADGIIIYDNVPGTIRMSLGDIEERFRIPAVSINMDAGAALTIDPNNSTRLRSEGKIEINKTYSAGPFMNDYSSWGATPDLKLKPDITSHGGEITSAVSGGYEEMSGTSMATPNLAGLMALVKNYLKTEHAGISAQELTTLTNQIVMSSATLLYDEEKLPYSPRKQGAGLATLSNIFSTKAYLSTDEENGGAEDDRPKIELGEDEAKKGVYSFEFQVHNFGTEALNFKLVSRFMTETLASDGLAVAEAAYMLDDNAARFTVNGAATSSNTITVNGNDSATIGVTLTLSAAEKAYLDKSFENGMYVEGFISLESLSDGQCDLNLPFMGFYGDWESAPMLDYNVYEVSAFEQDTSLTDAEKPHASVFATQLYSTYYNGRYAVPMGGFAYVQDENAEQVYTTEEYCSVSRFNIYNGATATDNYLTSTGIRTLYAGLLRNAELVTYDIYDVYTGELISSGNKYRIGKAIAGGGSATPALVDLRLEPDALGLVNNGKYCIEFNFYMKAEDKDNGVENDNTFSTNFYVDYDAPILQASRIRYYDYEDGNKTKQRVYLDLDVYDNHYPQSVLLCYSEEEYVSDSDEALTINLATEYVTPFYNPVRNGTNTVSIEITDIYEKYQDRLYVQIDDYALNHSVYQIYFSSANSGNTESEFDFVLNDRITRTRGITSDRYIYNLTLEVNEMYRVELDCGNANASNYTWSTPNGNRLAIKNNELFGLKPGVARVTVSDGKGHSLRLDVTVVESNRNLPNPSLSFSAIQNADKALQKPGTFIEVNAGQTFTLEIVADPWYYPVENLDFTWTTSNPDIATVDQNGTVTTMNTRDTATITASAYLPNGSRVSAVTTLNVAEPFNISNMTLNKYYGSEETVIIPNDENVMYIGEEAFKDNTTMKRVVIPKTVIEISERAFLNCTALEEVYFIDITEEGASPVLDLSKLNLILADAFQGCTNLKLLDLTNVKVITLASYAFAGCTGLEEIRHMEKIGIADSFAFYGCTNLKKVDISGLHTAGRNVFEGCTSLEEVVTGHYTALGEGMFYGCTSLEEVTIKAPRVNGGQRIYNFIGGGAFENCTSLKKVTFENDTKSNGDKWDSVFRIGDNAFKGCRELETVIFNGVSVSYIGNNAFAGTAIENFTMPDGNPVLGDEIFGNATVNIDWTGYDTDGSGAIYDGTTLVLAPAVVSYDFIRSDTTEIAPYAFAGSTFTVETITIPASVKKIGEGAFKGANVTSIVIPSSVTEIPAYAFASSALTEITIPASVTAIGNNAFENCASLISVTLGAVESIGDYAFSGSAITSVSLPESVKTVGSYVFMNCRSLEEANLGSVEELGAYTFWGCVNLERATFGENAKSSGVYTFYPGSVMGMDPQFGFVQTANVSRLTEVDLGGLTELGEGVFWACTSLAEIDLGNITYIGMGAFADCTSLAKINASDGANMNTLANVKYIGDIAFAATALKGKLNISNATEIGAQAFINVAVSDIDISSAVIIGAQAFAGTNISRLTIPASLKKLGDGAFMAASYLGEVTVEEGNTVFFTDDNVLYRYITGFKSGTSDQYEVCLYPANLLASESENYLAHYRVKDGTVSVQGLAFAYINMNALTTITLPYSVKVLGVSAFYGSDTITRYNFESIAAPALQSEYWDMSQLNSSYVSYDNFRSLYYSTFGVDIINYYSDMGGTATSTLVIGYPTNGTGYTNFIYNMYFGTRVRLGELMDDSTREFIAIIDGIDLDEVKAMANLSVNAENTATVTALSESVKNAHRLYNNTTSDAQLEFMTQDRINKLFDIESALKPVKTKFGIKVTVSSLRIADSSAHKTNYIQGEKFDITGLVLEVIYDDYSSDILTDLSGVSILPEYTGELHTYDVYVEVEYAGKYLRVPVTVTLEGENKNDGCNHDQCNCTDDDCNCDRDECNCTHDGNDDGLDALVLALSIGVAVLLVIIAVLIILIIVFKRRKAKGEEETTPATEGGAEAKPKAKAPKLTGKQKREYKKIAKACEGSISSYPTPDNDTNKND